MEHSTNLIKSKEIIDLTVKNIAEEDLGKIEEVVLDKTSGKVLYVVLNSGSFLGMGGKLFALPWTALIHKLNKQYLMLDVSKEELKKAPGFDKDHWPDMADSMWAKSISDYYNDKTFV